MFCKLAARNVLRSVRDYGVYLLTLTFGVCLFYTFNAIEGQGVMGLPGRRPERHGAGDPDPDRRVFRVRVGSAGLPYRVRRPFFDAPGASGSWAPA